MLLIGCQTPPPAPYEFTLLGTLNNDYSGYIYLLQGDIKDSAIVTDHHFKFTGQLDRPSKESWLYLEPPANSVTIFLEAGAVSVMADYYEAESNEGPANWFELKTVKGSVSDSIYRDYHAFLKEHGEKDDISELLYEKLATMVEQHPRSSVGGKLLGSMASYNRDLTYDQFNELFLKLDPSAQNPGDVEAFKVGMLAYQGYDVGSPFKDFSLPNQVGQMVKLADYQGKFTLVDLWASWCGPCRKKHPDMLALHQKYKDQDFEIISISIDQDTAKWIAAAEKDGLQWETVLDAENNISDELGVIAIPFNYLLAPDQTILGVNVSIEEIETVLAAR